MSGLTKYLPILVLSFSANLNPQVTAPNGSDLNHVRSRMQQILSEVSQTVERNFYDPKLNGVDWKQGTEVAHKRIEQADHTGEMVAAISGLLARLNDSHTVFIPPGRTERALFGFDAKPYGDDVLVYDVMAQGRAESAGLNIGDRILAVNEFHANRSNIDMMMLYFRFLNPNRTLRLTIARDGGPERVIDIEADLKSELSADTSVVYETYAGERTQERAELAEKYKSGVVYLRFPSFLMSPYESASLANRAKHAHAVILDLRENTGGHVQTMQELVGHFFNAPGKVADFVARGKSVAVEVKPQKPNISVPLFVLVDSHSASASEMFARFVQLTHRGKVIGDRTSGRVNAAEVFHGSVGSDYAVYYGVEISVARAIMPDGNELEGKGVVPDVLCIPTSDDLRAGTDPCLLKALELAGVETKAEMPSGTEIK